MHGYDAPPTVLQHGTPELVHFISVMGEEGGLRASCLVIWRLDRVCA
jgi:hypothetical protein